MKKIVCQNTDKKLASTSWKIRTCDHFLQKLQIAGSVECTPVASWPWLSRNTELSQSQFCDVQCVVELWHHAVIKVNCRVFIPVFTGTKRNCLRNNRVIVKNEVALICGSQCRHFASSTAANAYHGHYVIIRPNFCQIFTFSSTFFACENRLPQHPPHAQCCKIEPGVQFWEGLVLGWFRTENGVLFLWTM